MQATYKSLYEFLIENKNERQDHRFFFDEKRSYSSNEVYNLVVNIANDLADIGIKGGDLVALRTTRSLDAGLLVLALEILGTTLILCDPHNRVKSVLNDCKVEINPAYIITNEDSTSDISANGNFVVKNKNDEVIYNITLNTSETSPKFDTKVDVKKAGLIIFTSGSTGKNKAVMLSQFNYLNHIQNYYTEGCYELDDVSMEVLPIFHVFGLAVILMGLIRKYEIFFPYTTAIDYVAEIILKHKITRLDGVPSFAFALSNYYKERNLYPESLRVGVIGGAPSSLEQFIYIEETLGIKLCPVYGMSECIAISGAGKTYSRELRSSSVGTRLPLCDLKILDEDGNELNVGEVGEVTASGPMVMSGYYNDEEETKNVIINNRLHTGDLGFIDENDFLHIVGRKKDIIIRHGNNISCVKIEQKIELISDVLQVAVVPINHPVYGEAPGALIKLRNNSTASLDDIQAKLKEALNKNELPEIVKIVDEIPQTSSGKIDKTKVKDILNG